MNDARRAELRAAIKVLKLADQMIDESSSEDMMTNAGGRHGAESSRAWKHIRQARASIETVIAHVQKAINGEPTDA